MTVDVRKQRWSFACISYAHGKNYASPHIYHPRLFNTIGGRSGTSLSSFSGDGLRSFYFAIGNYYQVPEREVEVVRVRELPPDEVPVAFYVAQRARVSPTMVVDLRRRGVSWADIAVHFNVAPDIYYFQDGPPYGKAYGYWKKHPPRDAEVIDAVNIHFLSEYHHVAPELVRTERLHKGNYPLVARDLGARSRQSNDHGKHEEVNHGHGHGKGHDR